MAVFIGKIKDSDISHGKTSQGAWVLEARDKNGVLVKMQYFGYTLREAKRKFKSVLNK